MPVFAYKALDAAGKQVAGIIDADSLKGAKQKLRKGSLYPTEVVEGEEKVRRPLLSREISFSFRVQRRANLSEVAIVTRQLATLVGAGVQVVPALTALIDQVDSVQLKKVLSQIREKVNEGSLLGNALKDFPKIFSDLYVNMVRSGEQSGTLEIVLLRLADFTESQVALRNKIRSTMAYPVLTGAISVGVLGYMIAFVIPKVATIFEGMHKSLPILTLSVMAFSHWLRSYWWIAAVLVGAAVYLSRRWLATEKGRAQWDATVLRLPIVGKLVRKLAVSRFARTLATLLKSGVPVLTALDIVKAVVGNAVIRKALDEARESITEGQQIAPPLKKSGVFPPLVTHMIAVGEQTGDVEEMLLRVAVAYENEVDTSMTNLTSLLEPVMILVMGGFVAFIVMSVLLPILNMTSGIGGH